jgi:uncharacterized protein (DUF302 family)
MKHLFSILIVFIFGYQSLNAQYLSPYIKVAETTENLPTVAKNVKEALDFGGFEIIGDYHPAQNKDLEVIVFTRPDIKNKVVNARNRGALAAAHKVGLQKKDGKVIVSYTNPDYFFRAYLGDQFDKDKTLYENFHQDLVSALSVIGTDFTPFGGKVKIKKLKNYHYKMMMPYFTDPVILKKFPSFEQGYQTVKNNLQKHIGHTDIVYVIKYPNQKVAVFGIALKGDWTSSEAFFLPKIGEQNVAAMPYEAILQNNEFSMLDGKFRLAVSWPSLSMGTFMNIMTTPPNIKKTFKKLAE